MTPQRTWKDSVIAGCQCRGGPPNTGTVHSVIRSWPPLSAAVVTNLISRPDCGTVSTSPDLAMAVRLLPFTQPRDRRQARPHVLARPQLPGGQQRVEAPRPRGSCHHDLPGPLQHGPIRPRMDPVGPAGAVRASAGEEGDLPARLRDPGLRAPCPPPQPRGTPAAEPSRRPT